MTIHPSSSSASSANRKIVLLCAGLVVGMAGLSYAAVPLYKIFCQITGYGGTTQRSELLADVPVLEREITIRFDGNVARNLDWEFKPFMRQVSTKLGAQNEIYYTAENLSDKPLTGTATFNVTPQFAGVYFNKIECFCFTQTTLQPGEKIEMPVTFFIDPELDDEEIMKNLKTITLSYTFFPDEPEETPLASLEEDVKGGDLN